MQKGRKKKVRFIQAMPKVAQFSPRGKPGRPDEIELRIDQYEAINLADFQGYNQEEGAQVMGISRPSFGRILREGRRIVADALVNGKIIRIRIADVQVGVLKEKLPLKRDISLDDLSKIEKKMRDKILKFGNNRKQEESFDAGANKSQDKDRMSVRLSEKDTETKPIA